MVLDYLEMLGVLGVCLELLLVVFLDMEGCGDMLRTRPHAPDMIVLFAFVSSVCVCILLRSPRHDEVFA